MYISYITPKECEPGKYGAGCGLTCSVHCSGTDDSCDHITGKCNKCDPGYIGSKCDQGEQKWHCTLYYYGCTVFLKSLAIKSYIL